MTGVLPLSQLGRLVAILSIHTIFQNKRVDRNNPVFKSLVRGFGRISGQTRSVKLRLRSRLYLVKPGSEWFYGFALNCLLSEQKTNLTTLYQIHLIEFDSHDWPINWNKPTILWQWDICQVGTWVLIVIDCYGRGISRTRIMYYVK